MDYFIIMKIFNSLNNLRYKILNFQLSDLFSFFKHFIQRMVTAKLQDDINILTILKYMIEGDNIFM